MPKAIILRAPGTNCDLETEFAFQRAGATTERVHVNRLFEDASVAKEAQILCLPGGFSYGDDIAAGRILATQMRHHLADLMCAFREQDKLVLGICNGFQVLIQTGMLLPENFGSSAQATLTANDSGTFIDRWVHLAADADRCVFLQGIESLYLPIAHAEGKFVARSPTILEQMSADHQIALRYAKPPTERHEDQNTSSSFVANPNGSQGDVAGICDATGRVFGLMPHPERFIDRTQHPRWTREDLPAVGDGFKIFENAVAYLR